jgi:N-acetylglutamate synthase-like GNAT family acetyltransferase
LQKLPFQFTQINIRHAKPEEAEQLSQLALQSKGHWGYSEEFLQRCKEELSYSEQQLRSDAYYFAVAQSDEEILGFYALDYSHKNYAELEALFVEPEAIGVGIGKQLMKAACQQARLNGAKLLRIQGDPNATKFYQASGGKLVGQLASLSIPGRMLPIFEVTL